MQLYDPTQPLISIHIPKTAGSSLTEALRRWFPGDRLLTHYRLDGRLPERQDLRGPLCIHGHFNGARGFGVWQYYPQSTQFITFMREPFERFVSQWFHMHRRRHDGEPVPELDDNPSFERWLHQRAEAHREGRNDYSPVWFMPRPPGTVPWATLLDDCFVFVGVTERLAESMPALAEALGKPAFAAPHTNASPRTDDGYKRWRGFYERAFADEYELYEEINKRCG